MGDLPELGIPGTADTPHSSVQGQLVTPLVPTSAVSAFLLKSADLQRIGGAAVFFAGAALASVPSLGVPELPAWIPLLIAFEGLAALVSGLAWLGRVSAVREARNAILSSSTLTLTTIVGGGSVVGPPTARGGPPTPSVQESE